MENSKKGYIPMIEKPDYRKSQGAKTPSEVQRMQRVPYALAIGSIMYAVRSIHKYLRNTKDMVLVNEAKPKAELKSAKQSTTAMSSTKADYIVVVEASMEAVRMRKFIDGLRGVLPSNKRPMEMLCENEPAIAIAMILDRFFLINCRTLPDAMLWRHQNSSVADPPTTGVRAEYIRRLCENIFDLRSVLPAMLYEIGLTTIWKHVGHYLVFKDGEGNGIPVGKGNSLTENEAIVQHTTPSFLAGALIPENYGHQKVVEHEDAKSEADNPNRSGFGTHNSASPLNTIIPRDTNLIFGGSNLALESITRTEDDTCNSLNNTKNKNEVNSPHSASSPHSEHSLRSQHSAHSDEDTHAHSGGDGLYHDEGDGQARRRTSGSTGHVVSSFFGDSGRHVFPQRNPGGDGIGSSIRVNVSPPAPFVLDWNLTTHSILNDVESCRDMMINLATRIVRDQQNRLSDYKALQRAWFKLRLGALAQINPLQRYEALNDDYGELYQSHRYCKDVSDRLTNTQNQLVDVIRSRNILSDDHKTLQQEHLGCVSKESALTEKLLLPTFVQRLLSSDEYKKSFSDVFNQAIAAGWSEGMKAELSDEDAEAILATAGDYDPECKSTFMLAFDALFVKRYPYVEKLAESFRLLLGDL
ncbi:hypothetical protein Tco_0960098 [Tanacetum coccineum]